MMPQPPYSPDLAPCDFFLFPKLKRPMKGRRYATLDEIKTASKEKLKKILKNDFLKCFEDWKNRWHKGKIPLISLIFFSSRILAKNWASLGRTTSNKKPPPGVSMILHVFPRGIGESMLPLTHQSIITVTFGSMKCYPPEKEKDIFEKKREQHLFSPSYVQVEGGANARRQEALCPGRGGPAESPG
ncbi:hypothetical protein LAZ67_19001076 [Cordylochernes scorpioides]|uniref:Histone-lysine N-methyltransferase SETMAR n=1 Tax=Cordylochernes scorpioides TaxID=51811 RepID=A0ABY6LK07_9ARAC|nr:hypothetical protein LAZ67_19001076 [Cordylochernes scorpioides]